ncbi:MAG: GIY-YIG nuclease family protein [Fibrobacter sp.]|nr:GIY-YIG nuclease family protein [Fibrobacter sp.]
MERKGFTYILFNKRKGTLYVGVSSNLKKRLIQHKNKEFDGFTKKYGVDKLGYFEEYSSIRLAIQREKQLKKFYRNQKIKLIETTNPNWKDLFFDLP